MSTVKGCVNTRNDTNKLMFPINATHFSTSKLVKIVKSSDFKDLYLVGVVVPTLLCVPQPGSLQKIPTMTFKTILFKNTATNEATNTHTFFNTFSG